MSDPVVTILNGIPNSGTGTITTLGQTLTDGANVSVGAIADAAVAAGATGTLSAKLRSLSRDIGAMLALLPAALGAGGGLKVDGSGTALPISGAVTNVPLSNALAGEYETIAASQTAQVLGGAGATGDFLSGLLVTPTSVSPGVVTILDNAISINVFAGGTNALSNLVPFFVPVGLYSVSGAWKVTTGAGLSVLASGNFT